MYDYQRVWSYRRPPLWAKGEKLKQCENLPPEVAKHRKVLIFVTSEPTNFDRRRLIRKTWASAKNLEHKSRPLFFKVIFIVGKDTGQKSGLAGEHKRYGDLLHAGIIDSYNNLTLKVQMAIDFAVHECQKFDYVIKTDDDMYLNFERIAGFFNSLRKNEQIFGGFCTSKGDNYSVVLNVKIPTSQKLSE